MKNKLNFFFVFLSIGILNLIFLVDTIVTDPIEEFKIFSLKSSKTINILYYFIVAMILIGTGFYYRKRDQTKIRKQNE